MIVDCHRSILVQLNYEVVGECSQQMWRHLNLAKFVEIGETWQFGEMPGGVHMFSGAFMEIDKDFHQLCGKRTH